MESRLIRQIRIKNLLSFNEEGVDLSMGNLNVLIGPNGSGKSNFIEALSLLQSAPKYLASPVKESGVAVWIYGNHKNTSAQIDVVTTLEDAKSKIPIRHTITFGEAGHRFDLQDERIENEQPYTGEPNPYFYYRFQNNHPVLNIKNGKQVSPRTLRREDIDPEQSILSQRKDPDQYPEIARLAEAYQSIRIYREWTFGRYAKPRQPQRTEIRNDVLEEDAHNLGLVLNKISRHPPIKRKLIEKLKLLYPRFNDYNVNIDGGSAQIFFTENDFYIPATRLSDGTLRYLSILAMLYSPSKPSLLCIEEPELGLHPDILPTLAQTLKEASNETQIVITTHSEVIIDALTESPEDVIVCENIDGYTTMKRLEREPLADWLKKYSLGQLWSKGEIGGNRF